MSVLDSMSTGGSGSVSASVSFLTRGSLRGKSSQLPFEVGRTRMAVIPSGVQQRVMETCRYPFQLSNVTSVLPRWCWSCSRAWLCRIKPIRGCLLVSAVTMWAPLSACMPVCVCLCVQACIPPLRVCGGAAVRRPRCRRHRHLHSVYSTAAPHYGATLVPCVVLFPSLPSDTPALFFCASYSSWAP